jgi:two-component system, cell cycle sensor histidine kinase and response regulator CckA
MSGTRYENAPQPAPEAPLPQNQGSTVDPGPEALVEGERDRLEALLNSLAEGVAACDASGRLTLFNRANREMHGLDAADIPPEEWSRYYSVFELDGRTPFPTDRLPLLRALRGEASPTEELLIRTARRGLRRILVKGSAVRNRGGEITGAVVTTQDVTRDRELHEQLRRQADALRESEEQFRSAVEHSGIGFALVGMDGGFQTVNASLCRSLGFTPSELKAKRYQDIVHADDLREDAASAEELLAGRVPSSHLELRYLHRDGHPVWSRLTRTLVRSATGEPLRFVTQIEDIYERRLAEERLRDATKMEAVATLAGRIAHRFNNLLTVISGSAELIATDASQSQSVRDDAGAILGASGSARELTSQLQTFAHPRVQQLRPTPLGPVLQASVPYLERFAAADQRLAASIADGDTVAQADVHDLQLCLGHLVSNASEAMASGTIELRGARVSVGPSLARLHPGLSEGTYYCVTVQDTGCGLSDEARRHLYEPFFTTKAAGRGSGIGLATVYSVMRSAGGVVTVESERQKGTRVTLWLPVIDECGLRDEAPTGKVRAAAGVSVLVVDDEEEIRAIAARALRRAGMRVVSACSAAEALALLAESPVDVVLADYSMPGMSGGELLDAVTQRYPRVGTLLMSGYTAGSDLRATLRDSSAGFVAKPFSLSELVESVLQACRR